MIISEKFVFVFCFLSICSNPETRESNLDTAPPPVTLSGPNGNSNESQLKNAAVSSKLRILEPLSLDYWEETVSTKNPSNFYFATKSPETDLYTCLKTPITSCVLRQAYIAANNIKDAWRRDFSLTFIVRAQTTFGDIDGALKTIGKIKNSSLRLPALLAVANEHVARQNIPEARRITNKVLKNISTVKMAYIRTWVFALSATVFAETGDVRKANLNIQKALQSMTNIKESSTRAEMYALIAYAQGVLSDLKGATENIAHAFVEIEKTKDTFLSALALTFVADTQAKLGQNENYKRSISMAVNKALTLRAGPRALVLSFVSSTQADAGDLSGSQVTLQPAINTTKTLQDNHSLAPALAFIAKTFARIHRTENG